jgi:gliding motility-associated protein GldL
MAAFSFVRKRGWKVFMSRLYGWGASIVMIGALMKLEHMSYASWFLIAGLGTEAIIFFFSAFEPLPEEWEWDRVYPELADAEKKSDKKVHRGSATQQMDELFAKADITPDHLRKFGEGMQSLSNTASKMGDISNAHIVTQEYVGNVKNASDHLGSFSEAYAKSTEALNATARGLSESYSKTADMVAQTGAKLVEHVNRSSEQLAGSYTKLLEAINEDYAKLNEGSNSYTSQLEALNRNLGALNNVYEMQIKGSDAHLQTSKEIYAGLDAMMENLGASVDNTKLYREEVERLGKKLISLNKVYGNMLTAMNMREDV